MSVSSSNLQNNDMNRQKLCEKESTLMMWLEHVVYHLKGYSADDQISLCELTKKNLDVSDMRNKNDLLQLFERVKIAASSISFDPELLKNATDVYHSVCSEFHVNPTPTLEIGSPSPFSPSPASFLSPNRNSDHSCSPIPSSPTSAVVPIKIRAIYPADGHSLSTLIESSWKTDAEHINSPK